MRQLEDGGDRSREILLSYYRPLFGPDSLVSIEVLQTVKACTLEFDMVGS